MLVPTNVVAPGNTRDLHARDKDDSSKEAVQQAGQSMGQSRIPSRTGSAPAGLSKAGTGVGGHDSVIMAGLEKRRASQVRRRHW
jgi:hypothetical protein